MFRPILFLFVAFSASLLASQASGQVLSPINFFPGDAQIDLSPETQDWPQIAAGGSGFLMVWDDKRAVLASGATTPTGVAFQGNGIDIYAALLDSQGHVIKSPIIIANQGRNQKRPQVAWNGESFLVVWTSERPDWYFFKDIMAIRVSADGELLDPEPFVIRPNHNVPFQPNDYAENPRVTSDGTNWVVVWEGMIWVETQFGFSGYPNIAGIRIASDGTILDPVPVELIPGAGATGQIAIDALGDNFVVYTISSSGDLQYFKGARVRGSDLTVLDTPFFVAFNFANDPRITGFGDRWLLVWENQTNHDQSNSSASGKFISANGDVGVSFDFEQTGWADDPDVAVGGDRALVVWWDTTNRANTTLMGRMMLADGSFATDEFLIADANNDQRQPAVGWDGEQFVVAWMDFRDVVDIEHRSVFLDDRPLVPWRPRLQRV